MLAFFEDTKKLYALVWVPLHVAGSFTYEIPQQFQADAKIGCRAIVSFGKKRFYTALIVGISEEKPANVNEFAIKPIEDLLDNMPIVGQMQIDFMKWIADYYISYPGDVLQFALPAALKMASETFVSLHPDYNYDPKELTNDEYLLYEALTIHPSLKVADVLQLFSSKNKAIKVLTQMVRKQLLSASEVIIKRYKEKHEYWVRLAMVYQSQKSVAELLNDLEARRAPKQVDLILWYLHLEPDFNWIKRTDLLENTAFSTSQLKGLIEKGIFIQEQRIVSRLNTISTNLEKIPSLSSAQTVAITQIEEQFKNKNVVLLHGITGSGKTNIYAHLINEAIAIGGQVLVLIPEIALTTQLVTRFRKWFGNKVGVYHSRFNENERVEIFLKVQEGAFPIVIGPRSALFLPFSNLRLIIIDEEHEPSYKQTEASPRYHGRDAAIAYASQCQAKVLLGSATPAFETFYLALQGKYGLVKLSERFGAVPMPEIKILNLTEAHHNRLIIGGMFTPDLFNGLELRFAKNEQSILFLNRRGYTPSIACQTCGFEPECPNCDINLTYHKVQGQLRCHYCGFVSAYWVNCPVCKSTDITTQGLGTQKVEEVMQVLFPEVPVQRVDADTMRSRDAFAKIISQFETQKTKVLIGTQMVTKGLDFDNVTLVGIILADQSLSQPDFRARERAFQLFLQVAGRAGRKAKKGEVYIQTRRPYDSVFTHIVNYDYYSFYQESMVDRQQFSYPPFSRIIKIEVRHATNSLIDLAAADLSSRLKAKLQNRVLGPSVPGISKINNMNIRNLHIKIERGQKRLNEIKAYIFQSVEAIKSAEAWRGIQVFIDVDPV